MPGSDWARQTIRGRERLPGLPAAGRFKQWVEVVESASGFPSHVGNIQFLPVYLVAAGNLKLTIKISSAAGQRQQASARRHLRIYNQVINRVALLIRHA